LLYKSRHPDSPETERLWEESIVLIRAADEVKARRKAEEIGKAQEVEYVAAAGNQVRWTFERIESIHEVLDEHLEHGTELFSRFLSFSDVQNLLTPFQD